MRLGHPAQAALVAQLRYVSSDEPGIERRRSKSSFTYVDARGRRITNRSVLQRIESLAIPPAWDRVWICADPIGHLQATGYDDRGRKQYRYHADWSHTRNLAKFDSMHRFGRALPAIRSRIRRDQRLGGMPKDKVVSCVVSLLDQTLIRIGNDEYARDNDSYGLTTIHNNHAKVRGDQLRLTFKAKSGRECDVRLASPQAARIVRRCQQLPGQELFGYIDEDGRARDIGSTDINDYLWAITGKRFTAKDFRTWGGTVIAAATLNELGPPFQADANGTARPISTSELKRREVAAGKAAASVLCNTPATCRKYYVHPGLIGAYAEGWLTDAFRKAASSTSPRGLRLAERATLSVIKQLASSRSKAGRSTLQAGPKSAAAA